MQKVQKYFLLMDQKEKKKISEKEKEKEEEEKKKKKKANLTFSSVVPLTVIDLRLVLKQKPKKTFLKKNFLDKSKGTIERFFRHFLFFLLLCRNICCFRVCLTIHRMKWKCLRLKLETQLIKNGLSRETRVAIVNIRGFFLLRLDEVPHL